MTTFPPVCSLFIGSTSHEVDICALCDTNEKNTTSHGQLSDRLALILSECKVDSRCALVKIRIVHDLCMNHADSYATCCSGA